MSESVLSTEALSVRYGARPALKGVSLAVTAGTLYVLLGRNGAGKSSLVRCALGQQRPTAGLARLWGRDAWTSRVAAMARTGVVAEEPDAPPDMTVRELAAFFRKAYRTWDDASVMARLGRLGVPSNVPFARLSKGQKSSVGLSLAFGARPELLILDDPTLGLDAVARRALYDELIAEIADRGVTIFLTTHDLAGIEGLATRVGILDGAHLVVDEDIETLKGRFRRLRCPRVPDAVSELWRPFTVVNARRAERSAEAVVSNFDEAGLERLRASAPGLEIVPEALSLEDVFIAVTQKEVAA